MQHVSPAASALDRVLEVTVGGAVGFIVSFLLFQVTARLTPPLRNIEAAGSDFLRASGAALRGQKPPPPLDAIEIAFRKYIEEFGAVRREGQTRDMKSEVAERLIAQWLWDVLFLPRATI
jgi:uncharacterized membrane protein YgaE (UPF0421/DUF939 family)